MNSVVSWYILAVQRFFHIIACVSFLSISFFFSYFFVDSTTFWFWGKFANIWNKALELFLQPLS